MKLYIGAGMADKDKARDLARVLKREGHEITFEWFALHDLEETWSDDKRAEVAEQEIDGVRRADAVLLIGPGGRGMHVELGAALVLGKPVALLVEADPKFSLFYHHEHVSWLPPLRETVLAWLGAPSPRRCPACLCLLGAYLGDLEEHAPTCPRLPL